MFSDLQSFVRFLEKNKDLVRISTEVDPELEVTEIADRSVQSEGPALLFEHVRGSDFPLIVNVLGAKRRIHWALGRDPMQVGEDLAGLMNAINPPSMGSLWRSRRVLRRLPA